MSTCHKRHHKSHFLQKFTGKMPRPTWGPERGCTLCASLRGRNACPQVTRITRDISRATFYRNLQEKCRSPDWAQNAHFVRACAVETHVKISQEPLYTEIYSRDPEWAPWSSSGLYSDRKNPWVWTHCLGKKKQWTRDRQIQMGASPLACHKDRGPKLSLGLQVASHDLE